MFCLKVYPNGDVIPQTPYDVKGGYISAFEVKCKVHSGEGTGDVFVTECNISVSNTADLFSQEMAISIYDSNCTTHSLDNGQNSFDISVTDTLLSDIFIFQIKCLIICIHFLKCDRHAPICNGETTSYRWIVQINHCLRRSKSRDGSGLFEQSNNIEGLELKNSQ